MALCSYPKLSELDSTCRWDAEAYTPYLRSLDKRYEHAPALRDVASVSHPAEIPRIYSDATDAPLFLLAQNIRPFLPDTSNKFHISPKVAANIPSNRLEHGDVLVTRTGANSGMCAVYLGEDGGCYTSGEGIIVRPRDGIDGAYLVSYLNTSAGQALCKRAIYGSGQPHVSPKYLELTRVPRLGKVEKEAAALVRAAYNELEKSHSIYPKAEGELLGHLGWDSLQKHPPHLSYVEDFDSITKTGRADAEFFQPRIQAVIAKLFAQKTRIGDVANLREEAFKPKSGVPFHYIEIGDVSSDTSVSGLELDGANAPSRATSIVRTGDVITSTVRPVRKLSGLIAKEQNGWVCSSGFAVLQPHAVPAEYLVAYLRLPPVCMVMDAYTTATMYPAISTTDLINLPILVPEKFMVDRIVEAVQVTRNAQVEAARKLEAAKHLVEDALLKKVY